MFTIRNCRMDSGEHIPMLVRKSTGMADLHAMEFVMLVDRAAGNSAAYIELRLRSVAVGLKLFHDLDIDVEQRLATGSFLSQTELSALATACRKRVDGKGDVVGEYIDLRYSTVVEFVSFRADFYRARAQGDRQDQLVRAAAHFEKLAKRIAPYVQSSSRSKERFGLEPDLRQKFLLLINPGSKLNPFRPKLRKRNNAILLLAFRHGFRSGELLGFKRFDFDDKAEVPTISVHRRPDDPEDKRKVPARAKTLAREIELDSDALGALEEWVEDRQVLARYPKRRVHGFLFVERQGGPLAARTLRGIYDRIRKVFPEFADLCNHMLRHDWNDRWVEMSQEEGWDDEGALQDQCYAMGWSRTSKQPGLYPRKAIRKRTNKRMAAMNNKLVAPRAAND
ncbi:site-specific integrase [Sphingomonas sp.]|uniref:site-specific integrase n=1 Tax=Sphingomonas sp. TaxID=28214 RepID=UPI0035BC6B4F